MIETTKIETAIIAAVMTVVKIERELRDLKVKESVCRI